MSVTAPPEQATIDLPALSQWSLGEATWTEDGQTLESGDGAQASMLVSPPLRLDGPKSYAFHLELDFEGEGGITFGMQDKGMRSWLQTVNSTGPGSRYCEIKARIKKPDTYRLVLANCRTTPGRTRIRALDLETAVAGYEDEPEADHWKDEARRQWNTDHCGHDRGEGHDKGTLEYFESIERDRYESYAPWMPEAIGFDKYAGKKLIEIGGGLGTDLSQFAKGGAHVTDFDLAEGHLNLAKRNFEVRGLEGEFILGDGEAIPLPDESFDVVYSFGVIHHTPNTQAVVDHMHRLLKPGGEAIVMVYAKHSWNYWIQAVYRRWWQQGMRKTMTIDDILSAYTECSPNGARPLVKVYTAGQCRDIFSAFSKVRVRKYQLTPPELPGWMLKIASADRWGRMMGWNLIINAVK